MIKTISIDMSTCDENFGNRIFGKVIDQEGDNLICEFDSANYDFKQEKVIKQLKNKLNIAINALKQIGVLDNNWLPLKKLDDLDLYSVEKFIQNVECGGFIDYDGWGMPVIKTSSGKFLYKNESIYPSDVLEGKKLDCDYVAWFNK